MLLDPFLNVVRALAGTELDDPKVGETVRVKRILLDDGFDCSPVLANGHDNPAVAGDLPARYQEIAGRVQYFFRKTTCAAMWASISVRGAL